MKFSTFREVDQAEIQRLFVTTFSDAEGQAEGELVGELVRELMNEAVTQDITGFVATERERVIGCIFFTRLSFNSPVEAFLRSPVAVHTEHQGMGVGRQLITFGIEALRKKGVHLLFTYGDPDFYSRVGFGHIPEDTARAPFQLSRPEGWLCQSLDGGEIEPLPGRPRCVEAFNRSEYW